MTSEELGKRAMIDVMTDEDFKNLHEWIDSPGPFDLEALDETAEKLRSLAEEDLP